MLLPMAALAAVPEQVTPCASDTLQWYTAYLYIPSGNTIQIWFDVIGTQRLDQIGSPNIRIQRSPDGVTWTTMRTYAYSTYSNMMANNKLDHGSYVTYYGTTGYYYRAYVTIQGTKGSSTTMRYLYTETIKL